MLMSKYAQFLCNASLYVSSLYLINFSFQMKDNQTVVPEFKIRETKPLHKV